MVGHLQFHHQYFTKFFHNGTIYFHVMMNLVQIAKVVFRADTQLVAYTQTYLTNKLFIY